MLDMRELLQHSRRGVSGHRLRRLPRRFHFRPLLRPERRGHVRWPQVDAQGDQGHPRL